jgi:hypothetical protein
MSDLAGAASALGIPEDLVARSAAARAAETGASVDDIITAWAGGESGPTIVASPAADTTTETAQPPPAGIAQAPSEVPAAIVAPTAPIAPVTTTAPSGPYKPPVLIGAGDNPAKVVVAAIGLFVVVAVVGLIGPSLPFSEPGSRTSAIAYTPDAERGQALYTNLGCASCHTQMIRPVVADVGLGPVSLNDTNQILGARRFGPDLSDIGSRMSAEEITTIVSGDTSAHPPHSLSTEDMSALVTYMSESKPEEG